MVRTWGQGRWSSAVAVGVVAAIIVLSIVLGTGLLPRGRAAATPVLRVVATTSVFADLAANVGGERIEVRSLIPLGADPHTWEPSTRQIRDVAATDVFLYNGLGLEPWAERITTTAGSRHLLSVRLSEGLEPIRGVSFGVDDHEDGDPHFWLDILNAIHYVERIEQALSAVDPAGAVYYRERAAVYAAELEELHRWFAAEIEKIPPERRVLVTYHDAYAYMANRYGLEQVGFLVRNPDREPSPREMADLIRAIESRDVRTIFAEPQVNPRFVEALAREAGVHVAVLYTDALTADVPTYIEMMKANARALVAGLQGG